MASSSLVVKFGPYKDSKLEVKPYKLDTLGTNDRNMAIAIVAASIMVFERSIQLNEIDSRFKKYPTVEVTAYLSSIPTKEQMKRLERDIDHPFVDELLVRWDENRKPESTSKKNSSIAGSIIVSFASKDTIATSSVEIKSQSRADEIRRKKTKGVGKKDPVKKVIKNRSFFDKLIDFTFGVSESDIVKISESIN